MPNIINQNNQIKTVSTFTDLVNTHFKNQNNALCWERKLEGNYQELVDKLKLYDDITEVSEEDLLSLNLSEQGVVARDTIINDLRLLRDFGAQPSLNLLKCYEKDDEFGFISTDVYSFHVDRSPILVDTYLCTYFGASSDIISNELVTQKILIPEVRHELKKLHNGQEEDFDDFLKDNFFDLHYQPKDNAVVTNLGLGHMWRLAVDHPDQPVLPCVHRAPIENKGELRLMLIC